MKKLYTLIKIAPLLLLFFGCSVTTTEPGPRGPQGIPGQDGAPGEEAFVFEFDNISFGPGNDYTQFLDFPSDFQPLETDHILVYFLWDYIEETDTDVWRLLPQTIFTVDGTLAYNYDFTMQDVKVFMEANFDMNVLGADYTDLWIARVVVVPGNYGKSESPEVDFSNYHEVLDFYNLKDDSNLEHKERPKVK